jgi:hypothetical protein
MTTTTNRRRFLATPATAWPASGAFTTGRAGEATTEKLPSVSAVTRGRKFHWRGYYDKLLVDPTGRYLLAHCRTLHAGELNVPGLLGEARHSDLRSLLAWMRALRTPALSRSVA